MTTKRKLPLLVERSVADLHALRLQKSSEYDHNLRNTVGNGTTCSKGCSNCCHHPFFISVLEGLILYRYLASKGLWTPSFQKHMQDLRLQILGTAYKSWMLSNTPCALLENDQCIAYEARPLNCRITYAVTPSELCHPHAVGEATRMLPRTEVLEEFAAESSSILKRHGLGGMLVPLPEAVLGGQEVATGKASIETIEHRFLMDFARVAHG